MGLEIVLVVYIVVALLSLALKICGKLRLGIPLLYIILVCTALREWADKNQTLAIAMFGVLILMVIVSWIVTIIKWVRNLFGGGREEKNMQRVLLSQIQQAQVNGIPAHNMRVTNMGGVPIVKYDE